MRESGLMVRKRKNRILEGARHALAIARGELVPKTRETAKEDHDTTSTVVRLDADQWAAFTRALDNPPEPTEQLRGLMSRKPPWEE